LYFLNTGLDSRVYPKMIQPTFNPKEKRINRLPRPLPNENPSNVKHYYNLIRGPEISSFSMSWKTPS
jgi:hypothetical protein